MLSLHLRVFAADAERWRSLGGAALRTAVCRSGSFGFAYAARAATSAITCTSVFPDKEVAGYAPPIRRALLLSLKSRMTAAFVHLFLSVSGDTITSST